MPNFNFPHTFKDGVGETASGAQVMENLGVLKEHVETIENSPAAKISWGLVAAAGTKDGGSTDWTVSKLATGEYQVKWGVNKSSAFYGIALTPSSLTIRPIAQYVERTAELFKVRTYDDNGGANTDCAFSFVTLL